MPSQKKDTVQQEEPVIETAKPVRRRKREKNQNMKRNPNKNPWLIFYRDWQKRNPEMKKRMVAPNLAQAASVVYRELPEHEKALLKQMAKEGKTFDDPPYNQEAGKALAGEPLIAPKEKLAAPAA